MCIVSDEISACIGCIIAHAEDAIEDSMATEDVDQDVS